MSWSIPPSHISLRTINPIRQIVDALSSSVPDPLSDSIHDKNNDKQITIPFKSTISLSIGDPAVFGNMAPCTEVIGFVQKAVERAGKNSGYPPSVGGEHARKAIANKFSNEQMMFSWKEVIITSGCSQALELAIAGLANEGENVLIPSPGFSLYLTICVGKGIEARCYKLKEEKDWEVDIAHLESLINEKTRAIVVNNPSNPCGSVYTKAHLLEILAVAERKKVPIISDEIYAYMVFSSFTFFPMAALTKEVPIITVGGIAKQYLVPGWRVGWLILNDQYDRMKSAFQGMISLSQVILGANSIVQDALPQILHETPAQYYLDLNAQLERQAMCCVNALSNIEALNVVIPRGAMYILIGIKLDKLKNISDDVDFSRKLMREESVIVLPGQCFRAPNCFRIVCCAPEEIITEACGRIAAFCHRYAINS